MNLPVRSFTTIIRDMSATITGSTGLLVDMSVGSVLRAIIEANASIMLWAQWLALLILEATRAATSTGADLDSWMADFSFPRLPAMAATGAAVFSRYGAATLTIVPAGTLIKTRDGSVSFSVTADSSNPSWVSTASGYCLAIGVTAVSLPITAGVSGSAGNVLAHTITLVASAVPGIDLVDNPLATTGGVDAEADAAFRSRFVAYFAARSRATIDALSYAVSTVKANLHYAIIENTDAQGNYRSGNVLIVAHDGSGTLESSLLNSLFRAVEVVRPVGTTISIQPPIITPVVLRLFIQLPPDLPASTVQSKLRSVIGDYINNRPIASLLSLTRISQLMYETEPQIINVSNVTLNGQNDDLAAPPTGAFQMTDVSFI